MAYTDKTSVESVLGRTLTTSENNGLTALLAAVDSYINGETGRTFETIPQTPITRYYDVERSQILEVDEFTLDDTHPVEVFYVDADEVKYSDVDSSDYEARPRNSTTKSWLHRRSAYWGSDCPAYVTNIAVKAYFGASSVPADIKYVASWLAAQQIGSAAGLSLKSESIEGYSRTFAEATKTEQGSFIADTLARYREILI